MPRDVKGVQKSLEELSISTKPGVGSKKQNTAAGKPKEVVESWEEEDVSSSGDETETELDRPRTAGGTAEIPGPPPPTPVSPRAPRGSRGAGNGDSEGDDNYEISASGNWPTYSSPSSSIPSNSTLPTFNSAPLAQTSTTTQSLPPSSSTSSSTSPSSSSSARPEKTDAVARRMIAGALGVRAPKKTDEQREYEKAVRDKELRRRNREKENVEAAKREAERAKVAVWED